MLKSAEIEDVFHRFEARSPGGYTEPSVKAEDDHFRALVACLLSAQSRDSNTAKAKNALFRLADTPEAILDLPDGEIAAAIKPAGLYNMKTQRLKALCRAMIDDHDGIVPKHRAGLMSLPGIGRKCADIMLLFSFGEATIAVDTHVHRVCNRTGLASGKTEAQTAAALDARAPRWAKRGGHMWLLEFGKRTCTARAPKCPSCFLNDLCEAQRRMGRP